MQAQTPSLKKSFSLLTRALVSLGNSCYCVFVYLFYLYAVKMYTFCLNEHLSDRLLLITNVCLITMSLVEHNII